MSRPPRGAPKADRQGPWGQRGNGLAQGHPVAGPGPMHLPTPGHLSSMLAVFQGLRATKGQAFLALDGSPERQAGATSGPFVLSIKPPPPGSLEEPTGYSGRSIGPGVGGPEFKLQFCHSLTASMRRPLTPSEPLCSSLKGKAVVSTWPGCT